MGYVKKNFLHGIVQSAASDIEDEFDHLSEYHVVEGTIGYLRRIDQVGNDCGLGIAVSMSCYLVNRIAGLPNAEVLTRTEVTQREGSQGRLTAISWRCRKSGDIVRQPICHLFLFIGAEPNTDLLTGSGVALDPNGFVLTGADAAENCRPLETTIPGVFAIGDVRSGSIKRVAATVGEGAQVVAALHAMLAAAKTRPNFALAMLPAVTPLI